MNSAIVEYIGGIEVIKAFNQGKQSYARFSDSVKANASYFYHWMKSCQMPVSLARAISPTTMITILPVIILYLICQKYIIDGVVAGAVKG